MNPTTFGSLVTCHKVDELRYSLMPRAKRVNGIIGEIRDRIQRDRSDEENSLHNLSADCDTESRCSHERDMAKDGTEDEAQPLLSDRSHAPVFAAVNDIAPFIPAIDLDNLRSRAFKRHVILASASVTAFAVFLINVLAMTILVTQHPDNIITWGDCSNIPIINTALHVIINVLSSTLLATSNLCMQFLASPTRGEVDNAHGESKPFYFDIGIPSFTNLWRIYPKRRIAWCTLYISCLPLHFL